MANITDLGLYGGPRHLRGAFTGKVVQVKVAPDGAFTVLGLYGGPRHPRGFFNHKSEEGGTPGEGRATRLPLTGVGI